MRMLELADQGGLCGCGWGGGWGVKLGCHKKEFSCVTVLMQKFNTSYRTAARTDLYLTILYHKPKARARVSTRAEQHFTNVTVKCRSTLRQTKEKKMHNATLVSNDSRK